MQYALGLPNKWQGNLKKGPICNVSQKKGARPLQLIVKRRMQLIIKRMKSAVKSLMRDHHCERLFVF